jgi:hypothetical protein
LLGFLADSLHHYFDGITEPSLLLESKGQLQPARTHRLARWRRAHGFGD